MDGRWDELRYRLMLMGMAIQTLAGAFSSRADGLAARLDAAEKRIAELESQSKKRQRREVSQ